MIDSFAFPYSNQ